MKDSIRVETGGNHVFVFSPYIDTFPPVARSLGGDFLRDKKAWAFLATRTMEVHRAVFNCYGWAPGTGPQDTGIKVAVELDLRSLALTQNGFVNELEFGPYRVICKKREGGSYFDHKVSFIGGKPTWRADGTLQTWEGGTVVLTEFPLFLYLTRDRRPFGNFLVGIVPGDAVPTEPEFAQLPPELQVLAEHIIKRDKLTRQQLFLALSQAIQRKESEMQNA